MGGAEDKVVVVLRQDSFRLGQVVERLSKLRAVINLHAPCKALPYLKEHPVGLRHCPGVVPAVQLLVFDMIRQRIVFYSQPAGSLRHLHRLVAAVRRKYGVIMDIRRNRADLFCFHLFTFFCPVLKINQNICLSDVFFIILSQNFKFVYEYIYFFSFF